jgi:hypothetical protein
MNINKMKLITKSIASVIFLLPILVHTADLGHFIPIGDYPHATGSMHTFQNGQNASCFSTVRLPEPYKDVSMVQHYHYLPETTYVTLTKDDEVALCGPCSPCILAVVTTKDPHSHPQQTLVAHLTPFTNRQETAKTIQNIFPEISSDIVYITLHSAKIPQEVYEDKYIYTENGDYSWHYFIYEQTQQTVATYKKTKRFHSWKNFHNGHTQEQVMKYTADTLSRYLKIPSHNISVNLFDQSPLLHTSTHPWAARCFIVDKAGTINTTCIVNAQLYENISRSRCTLPNKEVVTIEGKNDTLTHLLAKEKYKHYLFEKNKYNTTGLTKLYCLQCNCSVVNV